MRKKRANPTDSFYIFTYIVYKCTNPNGFIEFEPIIRIIYKKITFFVKSILNLLFLSKIKT